MKLNYIEDLLNQKYADKGKKVVYVIDPTITFRVHSVILKYLLETQKMGRVKVMTSAQAEKPKVLPKPLEWPPIFDIQTDF